MGDKSNTEHRQIILDVGVWHCTRSNANRFPADQSKTGLNTRFQTDVNLSIGLNRNFVFSVSLALKLKLGLIRV